MSGYSYPEFLAGVVSRFPRGFCWGCVVQPDEAERCRRDSVAVDAHHVLPKQALKREFPHGVYVSSVDGVPVPLKPGVVLESAVEPGWDFGTLAADVDARCRTLDALLMDLRNGVPVRRYHHDCIEARVIVPSLRAVPREAVEFADELGLGHVLERVYGRGRRRERRVA